MKNIFKTNFSPVKDDLELMLESELERDFDDNFFSHDQEGQLAVDIYETKENFVVKSTIAGADMEKLEVSLNKDVLTIKGVRENKENIDEEDYLYKECYWGRFARTIILPSNIKEDEVDASMDQGVLTIILPKERASKEVLIKVKEE